MNRKSYTIVLLLVILSAIVSALVSSGIVMAQSSRSQPGQTPIVQKWEYEIVSGNTPGNFPFVRLKLLGEQGYEVAGVAASGESQFFTVLLKRAKQ